MPDNDIEILVRVKTDQAAAAATSSALRQHQNDLNRTLTAYNNLKTASVSTGAEIKRSTQLYMQGFTQAAAAAKKYEDAIASVGKTTQKLGQSGGGGGGAESGGLGFLRRTGSTLSRLGFGEIGQPVQVVGEIAQVGKSFDKLKDILGTVGEAGSVTTEGLGGLASGLGAASLSVAPLIGAVAGFVIGMQIFNKAIEDGQKKLENALASQMDYYTFIQTATHKDVEDRIKAEQLKVKAAEDGEAETKAAIERGKAQLGLSGVTDRRILDKFPILNKLFEQLDKDADAADKAQDEIGRLNGALLTNATANNTYADAILKEADARRKALQLEQEDAALTTEAAKNKLKAQENLLALDNEELAYLLQTGDTSEKTTARIGALQIEIGGLNTEIFKLTNVTIPAAEAVDKVASTLKGIAEAADEAAAALEKQKAATLTQKIDANAKALDDLAKDQKSLTDAFIKRQGDITKSDQAFIDEKAKAQKDYNAAEASAVSDKNDQIASINDSFMASQIKATQEFQTQEMQADSAYNKQRMRAIQDLNDQLLDYAGRRDVAGFIQAQRSGEKNLQRMAEDASDADKQRIADFAKARQADADNRAVQLADLEKNFEKEDRKRKQAYDEQLRSLDAKHRAEKIAIDRAFMEQVAQLQSNFAGLNTLYQNYYANMNVAAQNFVNSQGGYWRQLYSGMTGGATAPPQTPAGLAPESAAITSPLGLHLMSQRLTVSRTGATNNTSGNMLVPGFASGGNILHDGLIMAHQGERIVRGVDNHGGGASIVNIGSVNVGEHVTPSSLSKQLDAVVDAVAEGIRRGHKG